jgi:hypothetical protein
MLVALLSQTVDTKHNVLFPWSFNLLNPTGYLMDQQRQRSKTVHSAYTIHLPPIKTGNASIT